MLGLGAGGFAPHFPGSLGWLTTWGEGDPFGGPEIAREFAAAFQDATLELLPKVGYAPWMDDAEGAARLVREFLMA